MLEIQIDKPTKYADSLIFNKDTGYSYFVRNDVYYLSGDATKEQLLAAFAAHNPVQPAPSTDKAALLAKLGITADEAKLLLS
jgi:hypothetical protein